MFRIVPWALALAAAAVLGMYYWVYQRPPSTPVIGQPAPAFDLPSLGGRPVALSDYRGHPVILNFWATWCEPCKQEMPALQAHASSHPNVVVLGVDNVEAASKVAPFVQQLGVSFPILLDQDGSLLERYQVVGLPSTFFIDSSGVLRSVYRGALTPETLQAGAAAIGG